MIPAENEVINIIGLLTDSLKMYDNPDAEGVSKLEHALGKEGAKLYLQDLAEAFKVHSKPGWLRKSANIALAQRMAKQAIVNAFERVKKSL